MKLRLQVLATPVLLTEVPPQITLCSQI